MKHRRNLYIDDTLWKMAKDQGHKEKTSATEIVLKALREYLSKNGHNIITDSQKTKNTKISEILDMINIGDNKYLFFDNGFVKGPEKIENFHEILKYYPDNHPVKIRCGELYNKK